MLRETNRGRRSQLRLVFLTMALLALVIPASAQVGGNLGGVVKDNSGAVLPGVTVTITNMSTGASRALITAAEGSYRAVNLQPAPYEVTAELQGFGVAKRAVTLAVGTDLVIDFTLNVQSLNESVTVTGSAPLVETTKSQPSAVVDAQQVSELPVLSRGFLVLAQLMPGAAPIPNGRFGATKFGGLADQRSGYTTIIDGATVDDSTWGSPVINLSQDAVQEFKVFRHQFDAQYGSAMNAVVNVVSKSGGNILSGSGYYFGRADELNARNAFASAKPPFKQLRAGGSLGGPLPNTSNSHFFGAYEHLIVDNSSIVSLPAANPFAAQQNGIYPFTVTEKLGIGKVDHQFSDSNSGYLRYAYDNQYTPGGGPPNSTAQIDYSISHSVVGENNWIISPRLVNTARYAYLDHNLYTLPVNYELGIIRPSYSFGQNFNSPQYFPRQNHYFSDTVFLSAGKHEMKFGGNLALAHSTYDAHFYENGRYTFTTDAPFDVNNAATWPQSFQQQIPGFFVYDSKQIGAFVQDDWRVLPSLTLNLGLRYDLDTNLRDNSFYEDALGRPEFAGLEHFVSTDRGNDYNGWQPRIGFAWNVISDSSFVVRGGFGRYLTRMRPWFAEQAKSQTASASVRITDPQQLKNFPDINATLGGKDLAEYVAAGAARFASILPDDFKLPYSLNTTVGFGWQLTNRSSLNVDYVHDHSKREVGARDVNLPPAPLVLGAANPRPVPQWTQVESTVNNGQAWYDALEVQYRGQTKGLDGFSVSYTYSRSFLDAVTFYNQFSGTDRTPNNRGYNPTHTPHNLTASFTTASGPGGVVLSGVFRALSTGPRSVNAGIDLDGDQNIQNDRPRDFPITVGYGDVDSQLARINEFRANPCAFVYYSGVPCTAQPVAPITEEQLDLKPLIALDLRLTKIFLLSERLKLELFFEGYNVTNYVTPIGGNTALNNSTFGIRTGALDARQLQWGGRFRF
jgi:hypothetical protein